MNYTTYDNNDLAPRPTAGQAMLAPARVLEDGDNYNLALDNGTVLPLIRDVDFGVIPGTKKPCLYKSGAERLVMSMGVRTEFILESAIEQLDADEPFCFYRVKCVCYALNPHTGEWMHITDGHGSANTRERQVGRSSCWDTANARLKMAEKRALVDVALRLGQLSNMFAQDIENEEFTAKETKVVADGDTKIGRAHV